MGLLDWPLLHWLPYLSRSSLLQTLHRCRWCLIWRHWHSLKYATVLYVIIISDHSYHQRHWHHCHYQVKGKYHFDFWLCLVGHNWPHSTSPMKYLRMMLIFLYCLTTAYTYNRWEFILRIQWKININATYLTSSICTISRSAVPITLHHRGFRRFNIHRWCKTCVNSGVDIQHAHRIRRNNVDIEMPNFHSVGWIPSHITWLSSDRTLWNVANWILAIYTRTWSTLSLASVAQ